MLLYILIASVIVSSEMSECNVAEVDGLNGTDDHLAGVHTTEHICCTAWAALRFYAVSHLYWTPFFYLLI